MKRWIVGMLMLLGATPVWAKAPGKVLVVLSGVDYVSLDGGGRHPTGYFLSELGVVLHGLVEAGYAPTFATPGGRAPVRDRVSESAQWFKDEAEYLKILGFVEGQKGLAQPVALESLSEAELSAFDGLFLPGGHAPMEDLYRDRSLGRVLRHFHQAKKPTALICHAPVALLAAQEGGSWPYQGYRMTVFSKAEEQQEEQAGHLGGNLTYYVDEALTAAGGKVSVASPWNSHVIRDRELITGQNPMSDRAFLAALLEALAQ